MVRFPDPPLAVAPTDHHPFFAAYLHGLSSEHPVYKPYTAPVYSNAGYEVLAMALERITNRTIADMLEKDFFGPLGMTHSSYSAPRTLAMLYFPLVQSFPDS